MEIFELPQDVCTHLSRRIKTICWEKGYHYGTYKKQVHKLLATDLGKVWARRRSVYRVLRDFGVADQRSDSWHLRRSEMITASEVTKAFKTATPSGRKELLMRKLDGPKQTQGGTMTACLWGTQFEPIAKEIYGDIQGGAEIVDTTCVVHPVHKFIGASPDGIVLMKDTMDARWGKLVEFKCPISRPFTQTSPIPNDYFHQMQMQMECCNIDECDYVEMQFKTCGKTEWLASASPYKGVFAVYDTGILDYKPKEMDFAVWRKTLEGDEMRVVYWTLNNIRIENVLRDPKWLPTYLPDLLAFWDIVAECRADPSKIESYIPTTAPPDVQSPAPAETRGSPGRGGASSAAHTTTIRLFLGEPEPSDLETPGLQTPREN